jgi:uncharacterized repeat protein (TIGR01451 family)
MLRLLLSAHIVAAALAAAPGLARAAPTLRHQLLVNGDFALFGNTLAHDCGAGVDPVVGTAPGNTSACGSPSSTRTDSGVDVFWRSDPASGAAAASTAHTAATARSSAVLSIPDGATVEYARIYWAAHNTAAAYDADAQLETPDGGVHALTADAGVVVMPRVAYPSPHTEYWYQSSADVTALLRSLASASGRFTLSGVLSRSLPNVELQTTFAAWWAVVFFRDPNDPSLRQLTVFDGLDYVEPGAPADVTLGGFLVPSGGFDAKLGVVTYEGDGAWSRDSLLFQGYRSVDPEPTALTTLSDGLNPADNFFNGTRSWLGAARSVAGDLPQMSGAAESMMGFDLDVVDLKALGAIGPEHDTARIRAVSGQYDLFALGAFVTSINTLRPSFIETEKSAANLTRPDGASAGDVIEYRVSTANTGNDPSVGTVMEDPLPAGVTFVPGSLEIVAGAGAGPKTDAAGDDEAEYDAAARRIVVRLGAGADAVAGGTFAVGERAEVRFRVTVDAGASGTLRNQVLVVGAGLSGEPARTFASSPPGGGSGPTPLAVDACLEDGHCGGATPACLASATPNVCVGCTGDAGCGGATPVCDPSTHACVGLTTLAPAAQEKTSVAGVAAPFAMTLTSQLGGPDTYDLDVAGCAWPLALRGGAGAVLATRDGAGGWILSAGGDTNGDGLPDAGPTAGGGGTSGLTLWVTPPAGVPDGSACTAILTARGAASGLTASASATLRTGAAATWTPGWTGGLARAVARGGTVGFPGVIQNNTAGELDLALAATLATDPDAGPLEPWVVHSDPDGDGDPADGAPLARTGPVPAYGGKVHVVLVVRASSATGAPLATGTTIRATASATAGGVVATQESDARVQYAATYSDAGRTVVRGRFAPCETVYLRAALLPGGFPYALEWYASAAPVRGVDVVRAVSPWPVSGGAGTDALALPADAPGSWTVLVVRKTSPETVLDAVTFEVERAGAFVSLSVPPRVAMGGGLSVSAAVRSDNAAATLAGTQLAYAVTDGAVHMDGTGAFAPSPAAAHLTSAVDVAPGAGASDGWSVGSAAWPAPGVYRVDAEWRLRCGTTPALAAATAAFEVVPEAPAVTAPGSGALLATRTPTVSGTGVPGGAVTVTAGPAGCGPAAVGPDGGWSCTLAPPLADGEHAASAVQVLSGATSDPSAPVPFGVDATAPAVSVLAPSAGALLGSASAPGRAVAFSGTAEVGASVTVAAGGSTAPASRAGAAWTAILTLDGDGPHTAVATATDPAGNSRGEAVSFTLDTAPPAAPVIGFPANGALLGAGDLSGAFVTVTGTGQPDAVVTVTVGVETKAATFTGPGAWSATFTPGDGPHTVTATAIDLAGNVSPVASSTFTVDARAPGEPGFTSPVDGAVLPATAAPGGALILAGTTDHGSAVTVTVDGSDHPATVSGAAWSLPLTLADGPHAASAVAVDGAGNASPPATIVFAVDAHAPAAPVLAVPSPSRAEPIAVAGAAEPGSTVELLLDGAPVGTTVAAAGGGFSFSLALVPEGAHALRATAADAAGNASPPSDPAWLVVDRTAPGAPELGAPAESGEVVTGAVAFAGTAESGSTITVSVAGTTRTGVAGGDGAFTIEVTVPAGDWTATVTVTDAAGNVSPPAARSFTAVPPGERGGGAPGGGGGCGCSEAGGASPSVLLLLALALALAPGPRRTPAR